MSKITKVSRFGLFLFVAVFATTAISGESAKPSGKVSMSSRSIAAGIGVRAPEAARRLEQSEIESRREQGRNRES